MRRAAPEVRDKRLYPLVHVCLLCLVSNQHGTLGERLFTGSVLLPLNQGHARKHEHFGEGFSIDLNQPYEEVLKVVQEVTEDGIIRGTFEYRGSHELDGAKSAKTPRAFQNWNGGGTVLYKERPDTLAPANFYATGDMGTVVVRYIVQAMGSNTTRLRIDALFDVDTHHGTHPSDGQVESKEFEAIASRIDDLEGQEKKHREEAALEQQMQKVQELQAELDRESARLSALGTKEKQLLKQVQEQRGGVAAQVRTASADLKATPYNQSKTLRLLSQGEEVIVLLRIPGWYRVQTGKGEQGWIYALMLEVAR